MRQWLGVASLWNNSPASHAQIDNFGPRADAIQQMVTDREVQQLSCKMVDVKDTRLSSSTQTQWDKLTDDDLTQINSRRDALNCRLHPMVIHWVAVGLLVISQFTVIPMMAMITADTHRSVVLTVSSNDGPADFNTTTAFKGLPELSP